jgi:uncharacterized protein
MVVAGSVAALLGVIGWVGSERSIHPQPQHYAWSLRDYPDLRPQPVTFASSSHVTIAGEFFPGSKLATVVLSHGYGDNQEQMLPYVEFLHRAGFTVFTYDMRNRGRSGGSAVTLGALERVDLVSAVDYLITRSDVDAQRIGALGLSLGAATSLLAAAEDQRIRAVVDDSGFSDVPHVIGSSFEHFIGLPAFPFAPITTAIAEVRTGVDLKGVRPVDVVGRISPRPLLIIHCRNDQTILPDHSQRIFDAAKEPKQVWWIPTGGHADGHVVARPEYERRVVDFFGQSLR